LSGLCLNETKGNIDDGDREAWYHIIVTTPPTCAKDKYLVGFDCRFKRIFRKGELGALRLIRNLQATIRQKPGGAFVLVTPHCIFTIAEVCEGTKQHLAVEKFLSPYPLVVVLEKTVAQRQPLYQNRR
jgi:hypothetical protein